MHTDIILLLVVKFLNVQESVYKALPDAGSTFMGRPGLSEFLNVLWKALRSNPDLANDLKSFLLQQIQRWKKREELACFITKIASLTALLALSAIPSVSTVSHSPSTPSPAPPSESSFISSAEVVSPAERQVSL